MSESAQQKEATMAYRYDTETLRYCDGDRIRVTKGEWIGQEGLFKAYEGLEREATSAQVILGGIVRIIPLDSFEPIPPQAGAPGTIAVREDLYETMLSDAQELYERVREMVERIERLRVTNVNHN
jgi:hypothetical protein